MVNAHLDTLELELRKLDGVRTVGFTSQHDVLYIQLFVEANAPASTLPFEATRIAQRHSSSPVAVELVRWANLTSQPTKQSGLAALFHQSQNEENSAQTVAPAPTYAGSIGSTAPETPVGASAPAQPSVQPSTPAQPIEDDGYDDSNDIREEPSDFVDMSQPQDDEVDVIEDRVDEEPEHAAEENADEVNLVEEEENEISDIQPEPISEAALSPLADRREDPSLERIALLLVTTSSENDEIEVHLSFDELRTIGRAATNRGLLGAIDATVEAISELTGSNDFHAEWARSLEPGAEHASLVAVGLTNSEGTDTRHGIAGGSSPIEAAARATLNALNRTAVLAASQ